MNFEIHEIEYSDALFAEMLAEAAAGEALFLFRLRDQWIDGSERFDRPGELLIGAFSADELVGVAGVSYDPYEPDDGLARIRHVYVLARHRGRGVGRSLMLRLIDHAGKHFKLLRLKTSNPAAASLYEALGFVRSAQGRETHRLGL
jgi:GNAT superfamily N-acetyltransferase